MGDIDLLSRKELVEYLRKHGYETEIVDIIDNFPPAVTPARDILLRRLEIAQEGCAKVGLAAEAILLQDARNAIHKWT